MRPGRALAGVTLIAGCANAQTPPARGVVLISMDTLRADYTTPYGAAAEATPALARLANEGVVFERAYSQSNETLYSHGSMFTCQIPSALGELDYDFTIRDGTPTLAPSAREGRLPHRRGRRERPPRARVRPRRRIPDLRRGPVMRLVQETVPMAIRWLDDVTQTERPFFLFLHGYDAHNPYVKPGIFGRLGTPGTPNLLGENHFTPLFYERIWKDTYYPDFPLGTKNANERGTEILDGRHVRAKLKAYAEEPGRARSPTRARGDGVRARDLPLARCSTRTGGSPCSWSRSCRRAVWTRPRHSWSWRITARRCWTTA